MMLSRSGTISEERTCLLRTHTNNSPRTLLSRRIQNDWGDEDAGQAVGNTSRVTSQLVDVMLNGGAFVILNGYNSVGVTCAGGFRKGRVYESGREGYISPRDTLCHAGKF